MAERNRKLKGDDGKGKKRLFRILRTVFSSGLFFIIYYWFFDASIPFVKIYILLLMISIISSIGARAILKYDDDLKLNLQELVRRLIAPIFSAVFVFVGVYSKLLQLYDLGVLDWKWLLGFIIVFRGFGYFASDYIADAIAFQGGS